MDNKTKIYGLAIECPFGVEFNNCSFHELRKLKCFEKQIEVIDNMTVDEINDKIQFHNQCRFEREINIWKNKSIVEK